MFKRRQDFSQFAPQLQNWLRTPCQNSRGSLLTQTTRSLGFASLISAKYANGLMPELLVDEKVIFRTALAHHYYQLKLAQRMNYFRLDPGVVNVNNEYVSWFPELLMSGSSTFSPVAAVLSNFGNVKFDGVNYNCVLPKSSTSYLGEDNQLVKTELDPFVTYFTNLRTVVTEAADPTIPEAQRRYYEDNSPLPGAKWEGHLLQNPDEIMIANYEKHDLYHDIRKLQFWTSVLNCKYPHAVNSLFLNGSCFPSTLVSCTIDAKIGGSEIIFNGNEEYGSNLTISGLNCWRGVIGLTGEIPRTGSKHLYVHRMPEVTTQTFDGCWLSAVHRVLMAIDITNDFPYD